MGQREVLCAFVCCLVMCAPCVSIGENVDFGGCSLGLRMIWACRFATCPNRLLSVFVSLNVGYSSIVRVYSVVRGSLRSLVLLIYMVDMRIVYSPGLRV